MEIDWKAAGGGGERIVYPDGTYKVLLTGWQECESKTGTPQLRFFSDIGEPSEYTGGKLVCHTPLTEAALWRTATLVQGFGISLESLPKMEIGSEAFKRVLDACVGRKAFWVVSKNEQYNNNKIEEFVRDESQEEISVSVEVVEDSASPFKN